MSAPGPTTAQGYRQGLRAGLPFVLLILPFAAVFGIIATEAGLTLAETLGFSIMVIAGASQLAAVQLMIDGAPFAVVLLTALAVNLRMAMYSASLAPHLGRASLGARAAVAYLMVDQAYAMAFLQFERAPDWSVGAKLGYYFGVVTPVAPTWYLGTALGGIAGHRLPEGLPLDYVVPITFLSLVGSMLRTWAHAVAALVSAGAALLLLGLPWNLGLPLAGLLAMSAGALVEAQSNRRRQG